MFSREIGNPEANNLDPSLMIKSINERPALGNEFPKCAERQRVKLKSLPV